MDEIERALWCEAWRLLLKHGDDCWSFIESNLQRCVLQGDSAASAH